MLASSSDYTGPLPLKGNSIVRRMLGIREITAVRHRENYKSMIRVMICNTLSLLGQLNAVKLLCCW
jgi:hypothetical protein